MPKRHIHKGRLFDRTRDSIIPIGKYHLTVGDPSERPSEPTIRLPHGHKPHHISAKTWTLYRSDGESQVWTPLDVRLVASDIHYVKKHLRKITSGRTDSSKDRFRIVGFASASCLKTALRETEMIAMEDYYLFRR